MHPDPLLPKPRSDRNSCLGFWGFSLSFLMESSGPYNSCPCRALSRKPRYRELQSRTSHLQMHPSPINHPTPPSPTCHQWLATCPQCNLLTQRQKFKFSEFVYSVFVRFELMLGLVLEEESKRSEGNTRDRMITPCTRKLGQ